MRVLYLPAFVRDLKRLLGTREYARIRRLAFDHAPACHTLEELASVKKNSTDTKALIESGWGRTGLAFSGMARP